MRPRSGPLCHPSGYGADAPGRNRQADGLSGARTWPKVEGMATARLDGSSLPDGNLTCSSQTGYGCQGFPEGNQPYTIGGVMEAIHMGAIHMRQHRDGHRASRASAVVIDAYPLWLEAVEAVLRGLGLTILGKATSPAEGLKLVAEHGPEIVVT